MCHYALCAINEVLIPKQLRFEMHCVTHFKLLRRLSRFGYTMFEIQKWCMSQNSRLNTRT